MKNTMPVKRFISRIRHPTSNTKGGCSGHTHTVYDGSVFVSSNVVPLHKAIGEVWRVKTSLVKGTTR
jgi:hypothetical protein